MDIYELIVQFRASDVHSERVTAAIMDNLNDRRGIKQELQACDHMVIEEIFHTIAKLIAEQP